MDACLKDNLRVKRLTSMVCQKQFEINLCFVLKAKHEDKKKKYIITDSN